MSSFNNNDYFRRNQEQARRQSEQRRRSDDQRRRNQEQQRRNSENLRQDRERRRHQDDQRRRDQDRRRQADLQRQRDQQRWQIDQRRRNEERDRLARGRRQGEGVQGWPGQPIGTRGRESRVGNRPRSVDVGESIETPSQQPVLGGGRRSRTRGSLGWVALIISAVIVIAVAGLTLAVLNQDVTVDTLDELRTEARQVNTDWDARRDGPGSERREFFNATRSRLESIADRSTDVASELRTRCAQSSPAALGDGLEDAIDLMVAGAAQMLSGLLGPAGDTETRRNALNDYLSSTAQVQSFMQQGNCR